MAIYENFSYLDQLEDTQVDFEGYLNQQPTVKPTTELAGAKCANTLGKRRPNALGG